MVVSRGGRGEGIVGSRGRRSRHVGSRGGEVVGSRVGGGLGWLGQRGGRVQGVVGSGGH